MILKTSSLRLERPGQSLRYPDLSIAPNDRVLLIGTSGCGKTTLLSMLSGLLPPTSGTILFEGQDMYKLTMTQRDRLRGKKMGFVFQTLHLLPSLTLYQNIELAADMSGNKLDAERVPGLFAHLDLTDRAHAKPEKLSQGEQQRAAIARAVLNKPVIILADEPTSALDKNNAQRVIDLLMQEAKRNDAALLVATHDDRIMQYFDTVLSLETSKQVRAA